jgi:hypothetical protein
MSEKFTIFWFCSVGDVCNEGYPLATVLIEGVNEEQIKSSLQKSINEKFPTGKQLCVHFIHLNEKARDTVNRIFDIIDKYQYLQEKYSDLIEILNDATWDGDYTDDGVEKSFGAIEKVLNVHVKYMPHSSILVFGEEDLLELIKNLKIAKRKSQDNIERMELDSLINKYSISLKAMQVGNNNVIMA